jgi:hypothetical protein
MVDQRKGSERRAEPAYRIDRARNFIVMGAEKSDIGLNWSDSSGNFSLTPGANRSGSTGHIGDWQRLARRPRIANDCQ